jgi:hypothetical protein
MSRGVASINAAVAMTVASDINSDDSSTTHRVTTVASVTLAISHKLRLSTTSA